VFLHVSQLTKNKHFQIAGRELCVTKENNKTCNMSTSSESFLFRFLAVPAATAAAAELCRRFACKIHHSSSTVIQQQQQIMSTMVNSQQCQQ